jgi:two-component system sensor histidine kinase VicK
MFKSLQMRMSFVLILLIVCVMIVVGTFILQGTTSFYTQDFKKQMNTLFTPDFVDTLNKQSQGENAYAAINNLIAAYSAQIGITSYRNYYILDGTTAQFLGGMDPGEGVALTHTPNIISALSGEVGQRVSATSEYMDFAQPVMDENEKVLYVVYIKDTKEQVQDVVWMIFAIIVQAMLIGLFIAVAMSFLLSRTITTPIGNITRGARLLADGDFDYRLDVTSDDEIGVLSSAFNKMASVIKDTMEEIDQEKNKLETLFRYMTDGVVAFDADGKLLHINDVCRDMFLVPPQEEVTFDYLFLNKNVDTSFAEVMRLEKQKTLVRDIVFNGKFLELIFARFETETQGGGIIVIIHDVTQQQKLEISRREFIANVSHELRTPLTNIKSYAETVLESRELSPELHSKFLGVVVNEADRMTRIVKDLLLVSRLDNSGMDWKFSRFYPEVLLKNMYEAMILDAKGHNHDLSLNIANELGTMAGDRERLEQVVANIVSNAIKYTPEGGKIYILAERTDDVLKIVVRDTGIGIPENEIPRLFERFYRVDKARSREKGGTGLGLAIARDIIKAHSGSINIQSRVDYGTTVTITLPCTLISPAG